MAAKKTKSTEVDVISIAMGEVKFAVVGESPFVFNAMSEKAKRELLMPSGRKTSAQKASNLKHDPMTEYRASVYRSTGDASPTRLLFPAAGFKKAISSAALDMPTSASKSQTGRLTWVPGEYVAVYGVPRIFSTVVRSADINRTPDVRTRAILPEWACMVTVRFAEPVLSASVVGTLLAAAGLIIGIGDGRQEKGALSYGQFRITEPNDPDFKRIIETGGRAAQDAALKDPVAHDHETETLLSWFTDELGRRRGTSAKVEAETEDTEPELVEA